MYYNRKRIRSERERAYDKKYKAEHVAMYDESRKVYRDKQLVRIRAWYDLYKKTMKCSKCPEAREPCLDFHHVDPSTKRYEVKRLMRGHHPFERLMEEVSKCIILCANCHRIHHWEQRQRG